MRLVSGLLVLSSLAAPVAAGTLGPPTTVTCESVIDPGGSHDWRPRRVVLGTVAVPPVHIPQTVSTGQERWPYWSKAGLVVRAESPPVFVSVPVRWRTRVAIGWGQAQGSALRVASCPPSSSLGDWNPYAGGFQLKKRSVCVPLTFRVAGRTATVRFGVGKRCR